MEEFAAADPTGVPPVHRAGAPGLLYIPELAGRTDRLGIAVFHKDGSTVEAGDSRRCYNSGAAPSGLARRTWPASAPRAGLPRSAAGRPAPVPGRPMAGSSTPTLMTCGMYDGSGDFAIPVGVPAKSGGRRHHGGGARSYGRWPV